MEEERLLDYFLEDFALFIEAGFVAVKQLDEIAARRLFKAAETLNPESPAPQLGLGYIALNKLRIAEASSTFEEIVRKDPSHYLAKALLGVCYVLTRDRKKEGEDLILAAKKESKDPTIENLSNVCLDWLKKDLSGKNPALKAE